MNISERERILVQTVEALDARIADTTALLVELSRWRIDAESELGSIRRRLAPQRKYNEKRYPQARVA